MFLKLMYITNNLDVALIAQKNGVDRIWIDLETLGKEERQKNMNTVKSNHKIEDISKIAPFMTTSELLVRVNPWNKNSVEEINNVIDSGADIIMLPMWKSVYEVHNFIKIIDNRVKTVLLLETKEGVLCLDDVLKIDGISEIHIGLNDLHLSYGLNFMFELLCNGLVQNICKKINLAGLPYGFGGVAKIGEGLLPAEKIIMEHYRLGSTRVILSRSFCNTSEIKNIKDIEEIFENNIRKLRGFEETVFTMSDDEFNNNAKEIKQIVTNIVLKNRRN